MQNIIPKYQKTLTTLAEKSFLPNTYFPKYQVFTLNSNINFCQQPFIRGQRQVLINSIPQPTFNQINIQRTFATYNKNKNKKYTQEERGQNEVRNMIIETEDLSTLIKVTKIEYLESPQGTLKELEDVIKSLTVKKLGIWEAQEALSNIGYCFEGIFQTKVNSLEDLRRLLTIFSRGYIQLTSKQVDIIVSSLQHYLETQSDINSFLIGSTILESLARASLMSKEQLEKCINSILALSNKTVHSKKIDQAHPYNQILKAIVLQNHLELEQVKFILEELRQQIPSSSEDTQNQLYQRIISLKILSQGNKQLNNLDQLCQDILDKEFEGYKFERKEDIMTRTQDKIHNIMLDLGYLVHQSVDIEILNVDFLIKPNLVIEYQGANHYYANTMEPVTVDQAKVRLLKKLGYKVVSISYPEWHKLDTKEYQIRYIRDIIAKGARSH